MAATDKVTITLPESSFEMYKAEKPSLEMELTKEDLLDMYTKMTAMRRMEMAADGLYKAKKIRGFCHLCNGQVNTLFLGCGCWAGRVNAGESTIKIFPCSSDLHSRPFDML